MAKTAVPTIFCGFGSLMDIDKLIPIFAGAFPLHRFGSLMDIDKLILPTIHFAMPHSFGSLMDIDKLILAPGFILMVSVLVL